MQQAFARLDPFNVDAQRIDYTYGDTIAEIARRLGDPLFKSDYIVARINDCVIEKGNWHLVRPKPGTLDNPVVVTFELVPRGGGSSTTKNVLAIVAAVAVVAVTAGIAAGAFAVGGYFAAGSVSAAVLSAGVSAVGSLAIAALTAPPTASNDGSADQRITAGITGNTVVALDYLPRVVGQVLFSPPFVAPPSTLIESGELVSRAIYGMAGPTKVENFRINGVDVDGFEGAIRTEVKEGWPTDSVLSLVQRTILQDARNQRVENFRLDRDNPDRLQTQADPDSDLPQPVLSRTRGPADEIDISLFWPGGIYDNNNSGAVVACPVLVEIKRPQDATWKILPHFHFYDIDASSSEIRQRIRIKFQSAPAPLTSRNDNNFARVAYGRTPRGAADPYPPDAYFNNAADFYALNTDIDIDGFVVYLDPATFPVDIYEVRLRRGAAYRSDSFDEANHTGYNNGYFFKYYSVSGIYQVVRKQSDLVSTFLLERFATIRNDYPLNVDNCTLIALEATNANVQSFAATCTSYAPTWNGTNWSTIAATSNPAALYRDVLTGVHNYKPVDGALIDDATLAEWYDHCAAEGYECNAIIKGTSVPQALQLIASAGWAVPRQSETWGVIVEKGRTADPIVQLFTPRNTRGLTIEKTYGETPDAIYAEYYDESDDYKIKNDVVVYATGVTAATAQRFEGITYDGITSAANVLDRATLDMRQMELRQNRYSFEISVENLLCRRGDLVGLTHDVISVASGYARIAAVTRAGGFITGIALDAPVEVTAGSPGAAIMDASRAVTTAAINETGMVSSITFVTPIADSADIDVGSLVAIGDIASVYRRCIVFSVERMQDLMARLVLIDEAPGLHV